MSYSGIKKLLIWAIPLMVLMACNKSEDVVVKNNVPPDDHTIDSTTIEIYVNKAYINLLGREPVGNEKQDGITFLKQGDFSKARRGEFVEQFFSSTEYKRNLYNIARNELLRNLDSMEVVGQIALFQNLLTQPQYAPFYDLINAELARLYEYQNCMNDLLAGTLDYRGMLKRCVNNYFYDQINMGTENFVVSTYQNFLYRYPTDAELLAGKTMVDGAVAIVFLQQGKTKGDYITIFFNSADFYEGQVRYLFTKYLFREPSSAEIAFYAALYQNSNSYQELQKEVFSLDEYAGIH